TRAAELRSAGAWARRCIMANPAGRIAIIASDLDQDAEVIARQVRDGATPGWQHGHASLYDAVNVSYGLRLASYPAITVALLLLHWLVDELSSPEVGLLLKTSLLGEEELAGRNRVELRLRELPNRRWTPSMITAELRGQPEAKLVSGWLSRLAAFSKQRRELPKLDTPANWAVLFDHILRSFAWPGAEPLGSAEFQLINRWRELLNEFAGLGLVDPTVGPRVAVARLETMATEVIFQPETLNACVHLIGPLEASGLEFDGTWITGVSTANWPPAGTPSVLISKRLQEERGMPHCTPEDTLQQAQRILSALVASARQVVCSYAMSEDDAEQTLSDLLAPLWAGATIDQPDPGLFAAHLLDRVEAVPIPDRAPPVAAGERIAGGAGTIQRQINDPVSAFICGRMAARVVNPQASGIPPPLRGKLIHDALYHLYVDLPTSGAIRDWDGNDFATRIGRAVNYAFARHEKNTDTVLQQLLQLERSRIAELLRRFVAVDSGRGDFKVAALEGKLEFVSGHIRLPLRFDRIDSFDDGHIAILDYKTGSAKRLLSKTGDVQEIQLFVYAAAAGDTVSALALVNVDSREIAFDGVGRGYSSVDDWPDLMRRASAQINAACREMSDGDVRIHIEQGVASARPLNLLTRYTELRHENG
ncbi:MAG: PD-(D/E)XK nuclease family protein, partial [Gammaproteobacteria bacterium]|nr:PD-(D/E)XK nuclease family protein [Gammaproteobacteria bacterium]